MFSFFGTAKLTASKEFAADLAKQISRRYPPALDTQAGRRPSVNRLTRIVEEACQRAVEFHAVHKLGWITKAVFGNSFRWELTELGYSKEFVDFATEAVVVHLNRKNSDQKA